MQTHVIYHGYVVSDAEASRSRALWLRRTSALSAVARWLRGKVGRRSLPAGRWSKKPGSAAVGTTKSDGYGRDRIGRGPRGSLRRHTDNPHSAYAVPGRQTSSAINAKSACTHTIRTDGFSHLPDTCPSCVHFQGHLYLIEPIMSKVIYQRDYVDVNGEVLAKNRLWGKSGAKPSWSASRRPVHGRVDGCATTFRTLRIRQSREAIRVT